MDFVNLIEEMKAAGKGLMSKKQYINVGHVLNTLAPCNFLIFGLGEDAYIWEEINKEGRTVFLEDDKEWISKFDDKGLEIYSVEYDTRAEDHMNIGFDIEKLKMKLPEEIINIEWDVIFVDGPLGHNPPRPYKGPGRMKSIYAAHRLLREGGICIIDDYGREIESKYANHFFGTKNLCNVVENKVGFFKKHEGPTMDNEIKAMKLDKQYNPEGKSIALVGPAKYMQGSNYGAEIDSHDLVVRINRGIESIDQFHNDIGRRTDFYYSCLIERAQQTGKLNPIELKEHYGIKCLIAPPNSDMKGIAEKTEFHSLVNKKTIMEIASLMPIRVIEHDFHTALAKEIQCKPNTGFLAIYHLLSMNPKSLSIYGFSFYLDGFLPGQKAGIEYEKNCTEQEFANMAFNSKRHVQENMWKFAKETLKNNPKVKLDNILERILNLPALDKELFEKHIS